MRIEVLGLGWVGEQTQLSERMSLAKSTAWSTELEGLLQIGLGDNLGINT